MKHTKMRLGLQWTIVQNHTQGWYEESSTPSSRLGPWYRHGNNGTDSATCAVVTGAAMRRTRIYDAVQSPKTVPAYLRISLIGPFTLSAVSRPSLRTMSHAFCSPFVRLSNMAARVSTDPSRFLLLSTSKYRAPRSSGVPWWKIAHSTR